MPSFFYYLKRQGVVHVNFLEHLICIGDVTVNSSTCTCDGYPLSSTCGFAFSLSLPCVNVGVGVTASLVMPSSCLGHLWLVIL